MTGVISIATMPKLDKSEATLHLNLTNPSIIPKIVFKVLRLNVRPQMSYIQPRHPLSELHKH